MRIYNQNEQDEQRKEQNVQFEDRMSRRKADWTQSVTRIKGKRDARWNEGSGDLLERLHPAKLPSCEKKVKKGLPNEGNGQNQKADADII